MKKLIHIPIILALSMVMMVPCFASEKSSAFSSIPERMEPNTIITYDENLKMSILPDSTAAVSHFSLTENTELEFYDKEGRQAEDEMIAKIREQFKDYPIFHSDIVLPAPCPGMTILYGSDGAINHIYYDKQEVPVQTTSINLNNLKGLPVGQRAPEGSYLYGTSNRIDIYDNSVIGEGRFTVFDNRYSDIGSSGKTLQTGDVATKWEFDNPYDGTAITARALDTDIVKTVYKYDIGSLPDAVLDIFCWPSTEQFFGYYYSETLSFPGRYYYEF